MLSPWTHPPTTDFKPVLFNHLPCLSNRWVNNSFLSLKPSIHRPEQYPFVSQKALRIGSVNLFSPRNDIQQMIFRCTLKELIVTKGSFVSSSFHYHNSQGKNTVYSLNRTFEISFCHLHMTERHISFDTIIWRDEFFTSYTTVCYGLRYD